MESILLSIAFVVAVLCVVIVFQIAALNRILRSWGWKLLGAAYFLTAVRAVKGLLELNTAITRALVAGRLPDHLTFSQWSNIGMTLGVLLLTIAGLHFIRAKMRDFGY